VPTPVAAPETSQKITVRIRVISVETLNQGPGVLGLRVPGPIEKREYLLAGAPRFQVRA